jgi:ankyrin repeat protein
MADCGLTQAVFNKDVDGVRSAIAAGANINAVDAAKMTVLMTAAATRQLECVKLFLEGGADIHAVDAFGRCVLLHAVLGGSSDIVDALTAAGANPNTVDDSGWSLSMAAIRIGNQPVLRSLLRAGAQINAADRHMQTCLSVAIDKRWLDCVECVIEAGADLNFPDENGTTPLMRAFKVDQLSIVQALLKRPINLDARDWQLNTALMTAINVGSRVQIVKLLLRSGANVHAVNDLGQTALMLAVCAERADLAHALLDAGAQIHVQDNKTQTLLHLAVTREKSADILTRIVATYTPFQLHQGKEGEYESAIRVAAKELKYAKNLCALLSAPYITPKDILYVIEKHGEALFHKGRMDFLRLSMEMGIHPNAFNSIFIQERYSHDKKLALESLANGCPRGIVYLIEQGLDVQVLGAKLMTPTHSYYRSEATATLLDAQRTMLNAGLVVNELDSKTAVASARKAQASWKETRDPAAVRTLAWHRRKHAVRNYMEMEI